MYVRQDGKSGISWWSDGVWQGPESGKGEGDRRDEEVDVVLRREWGRARDSDFPKRMEMAAVNK